MLDRLAARAARMASRRLAACPAAWVWSRPRAAGLETLAYLKEREGVRRYVEQCIATGPLHDYLKADPPYAPCREDPRFQALLARIGVAD